eukprot:7807873-Alexandrium_andersonii.AAC.1
MIEPGKGKHDAEQCLLDTKHEVGISTNLPIDPSPHDRPRPVREPTPPGKLVGRFVVDSAPRARTALLKVTLRSVPLGP